MANDNLIYVRNARPNKVIFHYNDVRYVLEHRGHRQDSYSLPAEAERDGQISRWLQQGQLEKITKEAFMKLASRTVDVLPNEFLRQPMRTGRGSGAGVVPMVNADADSTRSHTQVKDVDVFRVVREGSSAQWGGDLMSTEEELESPEFINQQQKSANNYPSKNREDTRERGY